jgi:hypothetical protein
MRVCLLLEFLALFFSECLLGQAVPQRLLVDLNPNHVSPHQQKNCALKRMVGQHHVWTFQWANMEQRIKNIFVGGLLALGLFGAAIAGPLEDGLTAYQDGDYAEALRLWRPLANQGNAIAQAELGVMYTYGRGVPQNDAQAVAWLSKAAAQGNAWGEGRLGQMYLNGQGVQRDYAQAHMWLRKGAEQGDSLSQDSLGYLYETGKGVPQDYIQAHMWYNLAASDTQDAAVSETASQMRDLVAAKMTPAQVAEAQRLAREWRPK